MFLLAFILILVLLILVHEFGHFIVAKTFGIRVDEFGIFFPPRITAIKRGETEYSLNWLPFGGFVRIFGENAQEGAGNPRSFASKGRLVQAAVIVAGVVFNFLFAWLALSAGYMAGFPTSLNHIGFGIVSDAHPQIVQVLPHSPAQKAGLMAGDRVEALHTATAQLDTRTPGADRAAEVQAFIAGHQNESILLQVLRDGKEKEFLAIPAEGLVQGKKALGIELDDVGVLQLPVHLALLQGALLGKQMTIGIALGLGHFFYQIGTGTADFASVAGPIGIAGLGSQTVQQGFIATLLLMALISINLALINLLPIPGLDGGRLLFIAIEAVIRRPISPKLSVVLTLAGFGLLILLMLVVSYHDIARLVG